MGQLKENISAQKLRGGYYTPQLIVNFLCQWSIGKTTANVIEPSCGDGNFIESAILRFNELDIQGEKLQGRIKGIELVKEEAVKAKARAVQLGLNADSIINMDFFHYLEKEKGKKYDAVIGNPPFIRYQSFPDEHRLLAVKIMQEMGLHPNKLTNIWVPFLVGSASLLNDNGKLAMVIPAELFQVKYAAETRVFLSNYFERITIVTFKKLVFSNIQQEVVLLLCERKVKNGKGVRVIECNNLDDLKLINFKEINNSIVKPIEHTTEKWTKYFLDEDEINLLKKLKNDTRVISCREIMEVDVGLVTGRNEFFIMKEEQVREWKLKKYIIPVTSKSMQLKGITFSEDDFICNSEANKPTYLFIPPNVDFEKLPKICQKYIEYGEQQLFNSGYKTRIRKKWYITPSLWVPDAFALRQVGEYPKLIINETGASSTDTIHRVRIKDGIDKKILAVSFINSLSFAFSEITGRSYGGGVLTFEPTEIEDIKIPILATLDVDFNQIDALIRERKIDLALDLVDQEFLIKQHGFTKSEVDMLRGIWKKLSARRLNRTKNKSSLILV